jgi:hypothetical protein
MTGHRLIGMGLLFTTGCEGAREATDAAVRVAGKCNQVTDALGEPLEGSWSGFEQSSGGKSSRIEAHGSIKGPKGSGALQFEGLGDGTTWAITRGTVLVDGKAIDIVNCKSGVGQ